MELKGTRTEQCLLKALEGESKARNTYTFYASVAKKEGFEQIAAIFEETAKNEKEHAKLWAKRLGLIKDTATNLQDAAASEEDEYRSMYPEFAAIAREEGFEDIAMLFEGVGRIEESHSKRFLHLLDNLNRGKVFSRWEPAMWVCRNCGHIHFGESAPSVCPVCDHPKAYFEIKEDNF